MSETGSTSRVRAAIAEGEAAIVNAYWIVCDHQGRAVEPAEIDAPDGVLDEAFAAAQRIEAIHIDSSVQRPESHPLPDPTPQRPSRVIDYPAIDAGRTRMERNAEIIDLNLERAARSPHFETRVWA